MMHRWQTTFVIEGPKFVVKKVWWWINDKIWYVVKAASSLFHNDGTRKTSWNWFFRWRRNLHHLTVFALATHPKNVTGYPDPCVPVNAVSAVRCCASSPFRQRTDTRRASRTTRVHLSGVSWFGHMSLSCLSTFHLRDRPPVPSRFVTCVLWLFAYVAQNSVAMCRCPVLTCGIDTRPRVPT